MKKTIGIISHRRAMAVFYGEIFRELFGDYAETLASYTKGEGRVAYEMGGYQPCRNTDEVLAEMQYDPDADKRNPSASVFCSHGAGMIVPWYEVRNYMQQEKDNCHRGAL